MEREFILPIMCHTPETDCKGDKLKQIVIANFFNIVAGLRKPTNFPNTLINNLMTSLSAYVQEEKIKIVTNDSGSSVIQHTLNEGSNSSVLSVPMRLGYLFKTRPTEVLSQIVYAAGELVLWEQSKTQSSELSIWQVSNTATAYESELLLTLIKLSSEKNYPLMLNDSQRKVLKLFPHGLKTISKK